MKVEYTTKNDERTFIHADDKKIEYEPYFYVSANENPENEEQVKRVEEGFKSLEGVELKKVYTYTPLQVKEIRDKYTNYEADILFTRRYLIDNDRKIRRYRTCFLDIEVKKPVGEDTNPKKHGISCMTCHDSANDTYISFYAHKKTINVPWKALKFKTEERMLEALIKFIRHCDFNILSSYNTSFDFSYLIERMEFLGIDTGKMSPLNFVSVKENFGNKKPRISGRLIVDMFAYYKKLTGGELFSYKLKDVVKEEFGIVYDYEPKDFKKEWEEQPKKVLEYNKKDVECLVIMENELKVIEFYKTLADFVGCEIDDLLYNSNIVDFYLLKKAKEKGIVLPSKPKPSEKGTKKKLAGAFVFEPKKGIHENVILLDFSGLYPGIILKTNLSPETKNKKGRVINGISWSTEKGFLPSVIEELFDYRNNIKAKRDEFEVDTSEYKMYDKKQTAIKFIINSLYGVLGTPRFRLYDHDIASTITFVGRKLVKNLAKHFGKNGYEVIAGDTDSVFIKTKGNNVIKEGKLLEKKANEFCKKYMKKEFDVDEHIEIEFEKVYKKLLYTAKKRYAGWMVWKNGKECNIIDVKGFEYKRKGDNSYFTRNTQYELFNLILKGKNIDEDDINRFIKEKEKEYIKHVNEHNYEYIALPQTLTKKIGEYKNNDPKIGGVKWAYTNLYKSYDVDSRFYMLYVAGVKEDGNTISVPTSARGYGVICFDSNRDLEKYDMIVHKCMLDKTLYKKVSPIKNYFESMKQQTMLGY